MRTLGAIGTPGWREIGWPRTWLFLFVPIDNIVGVVELYTQEHRAFSREEVQLFTTFVRRARVAEKLMMEMV